MKQPKKLTRRQKEDLKKRGLDPNDYMYHSETEKNILLRQKSKQKIVIISKEWGGKRN